MKYSITINKGNAQESAAFGSVELVSYAVKTADFDTAETYSVELTKVNPENGESVTVASLTADGDTVATVLKAKLSRERKALKGAGVAETTAETAE